MISGIILAAGESRRIGSPKALLRIGQETFANRISRIMNESAIQNIILVAGVHHEEISRNSEEYSVVFNPDHLLGQFSSLQQAVRNLPAETDLVLVWPVDLPLVQQSTVETLLNSAKQSSPVTIPVYSGRQGHPVIYNTEALSKVREMEPTHTAKELIEYFEGRVLRVNVNDPAVLIDIDTPEDYERYITRGDLSP